MTQTNHPPQQDRDCSITGFGAVGDGVTLNTAAIQAAIDARARSGGGRVRVPPGLYLSGSIEIKSGVELHLEAGATLLGSANLADYVPQGVAGRRPLVFAQKAGNIAITGQGAIDGHGRAFFIEVPGQYFKRVRGGHRRRPGHLLTFIECRDVRICDIRLLDAPCYAIWPLGCDHIHIRGVTIRSDRRAPNTDGIDPDCCSNIVISDCLIDTGDDCIALKSSADELGRDKACENIVVSDCVLRTYCCALRVGYEGDSPIRNGVFSNLVITETRIGINMLVPRKVDSWPWRRIEHGPAIENLRFSNIVMETHIPLYLWIGEDAAPPGGIHNIAFSEITATGKEACLIHGSAGNRITDIRLSDWRLRLRGALERSFGEQVPEPFNVWGYLGKAAVPHAFFCRHASEIELHRVAVDWSAARGPWLNTLRAEDVHGLHLQGLKTTTAPSREAACLVLADVAGARIHDCRYPGGGGPFIEQRGMTRDVAAYANEIESPPAKD